MNIVKKILRIQIIVATFFCVFSVADASNASLSLSPNNGVFSVGEPFSVDIIINTGGDKVGTADATISFDPKDVSFVSVSDDNSIFSTILVDSTRKNGEIDISGFVGRGKVPFTGSNGLFAKVTFKPLRNVSTQIRFSKGAATPPLPLTASVGSLTNILSNLNSASYTFVPKESMPATVVYASEQGDFEITPVPVPDSDWFSTTTVKLTWSLPSSAVKMRTLVTSNPSDTPSKIYEIPVSSVELSDLKEGINYFLLQFMSGADWGSVIKYPIKVDLTPPSYIVVKELEREDKSDPRVSFNIESSDTYSGVDKYDLSMDGGDTKTWDRPTSGIYEPEGLKPGEHVLTTTVYDKAGNATSTDTVFTVRSLEAPALIADSVPDKLLTGSPISVRGTTYPNSNVTVFISHNDGEATEKKVKSDESGIFVADITDGAKAGKYTLWFTVTDERGATSPNSIKRSIEVSQPFIMLFGSIAVTYMSVIVPLVALILLLGLILWLVYTWIKGYRKRVKLETGEAYSMTHREFEDLRKDLIKQIGVLEKANQSRELTREEMKIFTNLSKRLDKIEKHIEQEIEDIEDVDEVQESVVRTHDVRGSLEKYKNKINGKSVTVNNVSDTHSDNVVHLKPKRSE